MRWLRRHDHRDWELGPAEQLAADELEHLADAAPPSPRADEVRMLVLREADERATSAPGGLGVVGVALVSLVLAMLLGVGGVFVGSLVQDPETLAPSDPASPTMELAPSGAPLPTVGTPRAEASPSPSPSAGAEDEPTGEPEATPLPGDSPDPGSDDDDPDDSGPPPHISPGGPPSPMPGPAGSGDQP